MLNCQRLYNQFTSAMDPKAVSAPTTVLQDAARQRRVALSLNRPWVDTGGRSARGLQGVHCRTAPHRRDRLSSSVISPVPWPWPNFLSLTSEFWFSLIQPDFFLVNIYIYLYLYILRCILQTVASSSSFCVCVVVHAYGLKTEPAFCRFFIVFWKSSYDIVWVGWGGVITYMLRCCKISCTFIYTSRYAAASSLALPYIPTYYANKKNQALVKNKEWRKNEGKKWPPLWFWQKLSKHGHPKLLGKTLSHETVKKWWFLWDERKGQKHDLFFHVGSINNPFRVLMAAKDRTILRQCGWSRPSLLIQLAVW